MGTLDGFVLAPEDFKPFGQGFNRPECVVAEHDGTLFVSDCPGGIVRVSPAGEYRRLGNIAGVPNGHAMDARRNLIVTDIENGRLWKIGQDGSQEVILDSLDGAPLGAVNFVMIDSRGALWVSVSTMMRPRTDAVSNPRPDGYIIRIDEGEARIVADGLFFTNELRFDRDETYLYVAETSRGGVLRFPLMPDRQLGPRECFGAAPLFNGARVDGIAFDEDDNLWVTDIARNGIHVIDPAGRTHCVFEDPDGAVLRVPTSIAFGGADRRTAVIGSLTMDRLMTFRAPVAGQALNHWRSQDSLAAHAVIAR